MKRTSRFFLAMALALLLGTTGQARELLRPDHPASYVVQRGDTLWDIAGRFLNEPWRWPEIWRANPQIENPDLIYPGDRLTLQWVAGKPRLALERGPVRLSPGVRSEPVRMTIPAIPIDHIAPYLSRPYVMDRGTLRHLPYVVAFADEHIAAGAGQRIYVRQIEDQAHKQFDIVRPGKPYRDSRSGEILGYEALYAGSGVLDQPGDPAILSVIRTRRAVLPGDRLLPFTEQNAAADYHPHAPEKAVEGAIIDVMERVNEIGQYDVVVLDLGRADGVDEGTVLQINNRGEMVPDEVGRQERYLVPDMAEYLDPDLIHQIEYPGWNRPALWETVKLPDEEAGLLLVFRSFERVSFGLVMYARKAIHLHDRVVNPL